MFRNKFIYRSNNKTRSKYLFLWFAAPRIVLKFNFFLICRNPYRGDHQKQKINPISCNRYSCSNDDNSSTTSDICMIVQLQTKTLFAAKIAASHSWRKHYYILIYCNYQTCFGCVGCHDFSGDSC